MKLILASRNPGKLRELQELLSGFGVEILLESQVGLDLEVEETGTTFEENSLLKARAVMEAAGLAAIADDSGLEVDALNGAPGVYSARYGGLDSDEARTALLLQRLEAVPDAQRTARFVSVLTACLPDGRVIQARGTCAPWQRRLRLRSGVPRAGAGTDLCGDAGGGEEPDFSQSQRPAAVRRKMGEGDSPC